MTSQSVNILEFISPESTHKTTEKVYNYTGGRRLEAVLLKVGHKSSPLKGIRMLAVTCYNNLVCTGAVGNLNLLNTGVITRQKDCFSNDYNKNSNGPCDSVIED